jgi:hypothetical protein
MAINTTVLGIIDKDEMSESFDTFPPHPVPPFHLVGRRFSSSLHGRALVEYDTVATGELSSDGKEEEGTDTMVP